MILSAPKGSFKPPERNARQLNRRWRRPLNPMKAELPAERRGSSPCRLWRWPKGPGLTRVGPSEIIIIGCRGHPSALLSSLTTGGDAPPRDCHGRLLSRYGGFQAQTLE